MQTKISELIAILIVSAVLIGLFFLTGWGISFLANVVLSQIGLGSINIVGGCSIVWIVIILKSAGKLFK